MGCVQDKDRKPHIIDDKNIAKSKPKEKEKDRANTEPIDQLPTTTQKLESNKIYKNKQEPTLNAPFTT